jgi:hypothetical protein
VLRDGVSSTIANIGALGTKLHRRRHPGSIIAIVAMAFGSPPAMAGTKPKSLRFADDDVIGSK